MCLIHEKIRIVGISRSYEYSPNHVDNDAAIFKIVAQKLEEKDIDVEVWTEKDKFTAEYALKDINKPIGVSEYKLLEDIPEYLQSQLPKAEDIELHIKEIE